MASGCRIEISYIDPETYASVVNHDLRKSILRALYAMTTAWASDITSCHIS